MKAKTGGEGPNSSPPQKKSSKMEIVLKDHDPATVATIAAALIQGCDGVPYREAVRGALDLLDESRRALADRVKEKDESVDPGVPWQLPYKEGLEFITRIKKRPGRAEHRFKGMLASGNMLEDWEKLF